MEMNVKGEINYIAEDILKVLTFDLVQPTKITGEADCFDCDINIEMTNGDKLNIFYKGDGAGREPEVHKLSINGNSSSFELDGEDILYEVRALYINHLNRKLRA